MFLMSFDQFDVEFISSVEMIVRANVALYPPNLHLHVTEEVHRRRSEL